MFGLATTLIGSEWKDGGLELEPSPGGPSSQRFCTSVIYIYIYIKYYTVGDYTPEISDQ